MSFLASLFITQPAVASLVKRSLFQGTMDLLSAHSQSKFILAAPRPQSSYFIERLARNFVDQGHKIYLKDFLIKAYRESLVEVTELYRVCQATKNFSSSLQRIEAPPLARLPCRTPNPAGRTRCRSSC
jgi:hypothetical protein